MSIVIHSQFRNGPKWHRRYSSALIDGFKARGEVVASCKEGDSIDGFDPSAIHVIFGPNYFPKTFAAAKKAGLALTINRCFYGDVNDDVSIGWNGFNGLATFPGYVHGRLEKERHKLPAQSWKPPATNNVALILGEFPSACDNKQEINQFYADSVEDAKQHGLLPVFRPHPLAKHRINGAADAPGELTAAARVYTYASTYGVHARLIGAPISAHPASLAYEDIGDFDNWLERVVAAQWHITEITRGDFWEHLNYYA